MSTVKTPRGYKEDFDTDSYLTGLYSAIDTEDEAGLLKYRVDMLHGIFATGNIKGEKLLDIGTGPTVYSVISASRYVTEIHLSDYLERHREIVQNWLDGAPNSECVFEYIKNKENDGTTFLDRVNEVRRKVKKIYAIDLLQDKPFEGLDCKYDVITSSLCLDCPTQSVEEHGKIIAKIADMLQPGGFFIMIGVTGCTYYRVGDFKFFNIFINTDQLKNNFAKAGFEIKVLKEAGPEGYHPEKMPADICDADDMFVIAAQKKA